MSVESLLQTPEGKRLEFKCNFSSPKKLLKTLVAFANSAGGKLIVGVNDDRHVVGVEAPLDQEERLCSLIADSIVPRLAPNIELTTVENKTLLLVEVFLSNLRPHYLRAEGPTNGVYVRLGSTNRQADQELIAELRRSAEGMAFDEMPMSALTADALDLQAAQAIFGERRTLNKKSLQTLKLLVPHQGHLVPTKGAIFLFGKERTFHFPDAWVQCGRFIGCDKADIFDHIELDEPLPQLVDSILLFLKKHAMRGADFSEIRRKDVWSIPLLILREAVINALVHADYSQRGAPIRIAFFDDRIEVESPGILLPGMTIEDMKAGISKIRNPVLARVFHELSLIEQWGSGVPRIFTQAKEQGLPEPELQEIGMRLRFTVRLAHSIEVAESVANVPPGPESRLESRLESSLAAKVVAYLAEAPAGKAALAKRLGHKSVSGELHKQVRRLLDAGWIEMTLPDKPSSRLQRYQLTKQGRSWLASSKKEKTR